MNCVYCETELPEKGFYCPNCTKQAKCKHCSESLLKDAKICVMCGEDLNTKALPPNVNTIVFSETETSREFRASVTDTLGNSISDALGFILANKVGGFKRTQTINLPPANGNGEQNDQIETPLDPLMNSNDSTELSQLKKIFKDDGEKVTLNETRLKAKSRADYGKRLALLFLYYKNQKGVENVPRKDLTSIAQNASIEDGNFRYWLLHNPLARIEGDSVVLNAPGRDAAQKFLKEIFNSEIKDGWQIGSSNRSSKKNKEKKPEKKA